MIKCLSNEQLIRLFYFRQYALQRAYTSEQVVIILKQFRRIIAEMYTRGIDVP